VSGMEVEDRLNNRVSRRTVVGTGAKLAYAAPIVAASFKLTASGALAQAQTCLPDYTYIEILNDCCICDCTTIGVTIDPTDGTCHNPNGQDVTEFCRTCNGLANVSPG
jgi:hypothetical protein